MTEKDLNSITLNIAYLSITIVSLVFIVCGHQSTLEIHLLTTPHNLSCFHCSTLNDGDSCRYLQTNNAQVQISCDVNQIFCSVVLFQYTTDSNEFLFWSVERSCEATCQDGCSIVGERIKLYLCRSCCTGYLCNDGNGAQNLVKPVNTLCLIALCVALIKVFSSATY